MTWNSFRRCFAGTLLALAVGAILPQVRGDDPPDMKAPLHLTDKTLVAWVQLANLEQRAGSVLSLVDPKERFDAIVFGELAPGRWMNGSEFYQRTAPDQSAYPAETAGPQTRLQIAAVYQGKTVRLYRDGTLYAEHEFAEPLTFGDDVAVVLGLRHMTSEGEGRGYFQGAIRDARIYDHALEPTELAALVPDDPAGPPPLGWWTFEGDKAVEHTGRFPYLQLHGGAKIAGGWLELNGTDACLVGRTRETPRPYASPIHYRPKVGRLADTIPFFANGQYHVFYLRAIDKVPWEHIVSTDLVHWTDLPTALRSDGPDDGPDGQHMFTGSVVERDGTYHIFYTGWNPRNPAGLEFVRHATSPDLVTWTKHPEFLFGPDGTLYSNARQRDFRDPFVFWNPETKAFWMFLCTGARTGVATSPDLETWQLAPPLESDYAGMGTPECPDSFKIGDTYYLIMSPTATASTYARSAPALRGPYHDPVSPAVDTRILYAAKSLFDGKRQVLVGWIRDLEGDRDGGAEQWGGTMCVPREIAAGAGGQLLFRPVPEAVAVFGRTVLNLSDKPSLQAPRWSFDGSTLVGEAAGASQVRFDVPDHYMLQAKVKLDPGASLTVAFREQSAAGSGYRLTVSPTAQRAELAGAAFRYARAIPIDATQPVTLTAFAQGSIIECFLDDGFAFSCRAYDWPTGALGLSVSGGRAQVEELTVKTAVQ